MVLTAAKRRVVLFDLDGTLYDSHGPWEAANHAAIESMMRHGMRARTQAEAFEKLRQIYDKGPQDERHLHRLATHFLKQQGLKGHVLKEKLAAVVREGKRAYEEVQADPLVFKPYEGVRELLQELHDRGVKYYVVTNGLPKKQWDKIERLGLTDLISQEQLHCTGKGRISSILKRTTQTKPKDARFFQTVLKKIGVRPHQALMVGDREESDITPALAAGLVTLRLKKGKYASEKTVAHFEATEMHKVREHVNTFLEAA